MKHISRNIILSLGIVAPTISSPVMLLTSCSQVWGYVSPLQFGSVLKNDVNNPFIKFDGQKILDNNGNNMVDYLQSNYTIDSRTGNYYAYSSPVTKWLYDKESAEAKAAESQIMPIDKWEHNNLGWKTSSSTDFTSNASFNGTLKNDKYVTVVNNENVILASNITFTSSIASTIASYFAGAFKYQSSQIAENSDENLNIAWGSACEKGDRYSLYHGAKDTAQPIADNINNLFYEYIFAQANAHVSNKNNRGAFLRSTSANFNYDALPIPSYEFNTGKRIDLDGRTKKLLLGPNADLDTQFCLTGTDTLPAYYSSKTDGTQEITIGDSKTDSKPVNVKLSYTDYTFNAVPILVTARDITQRWVNPTKNNSIQVRDYYVNEQDTVKNAVGKFTNIGKYANHTGDVTVKTYKFDTTPAAGLNKIEFEVNGTEYDSVKKVDTRIVSADKAKMYGNKFIALVTYTVREYNNNKFLYKDGQPSEYVNGLIEAFGKIGDTTKTTAAEVIAWLRSRNLASLSSASTIFPAYFLTLYNDLFVKANTKLDDGQKTGYILDTTKISNHCNDLLGILNRSTKQGYIAHAKDLTQDSKNLLGFLKFMFANQTAEADKYINFLTDVVDIEEF